MIRKAHLKNKHVSKKTRNKTCNRPNAESTVEFFLKSEANEAMQSLSSIEMDYLMSERLQLHAASFLANSHCGE